MHLANLGALLHHPRRTFTVLLTMACSLGMAGQETAHWSELMRNPDIPIDSVKKAYERWAEEGHHGRGKDKSPLSDGCLLQRRERAKMDGDRPTEKP